MQKKSKRFAAVFTIALTAAFIPLGLPAQADDRTGGGDAPTQQDDVTRVEVPIQTTSPEVAEYIVGGTDATAVRFEYVNAVGEYTIYGKDNWGEEMNADLQEEYGTPPPVTAVVFESTEPPPDEQVEDVRIRAHQAKSTAQRSTTADIMADVSPLDPTREMQSAQRTQGVDLTALDDLPDWYPSWHMTRAHTLGDGTREIVVSLEWSEGQSPGGGNWGGTRGLEIETNLRNPAGAGITRYPNPFNNCPDDDLGFWTARNPDKSVDFWALESPSGQDLRASKPYFDTVNSTDSCEFMSQTVGIGLPNRLPAQEWNPEYWLVRTRIQGVSGTKPDSPMMGNIDPVSNDCPTGAIASECMGISDEINALDVPSEAMFSYERGITAPGCAAREYGGEPFACF